MARTQPQLLPEPDGDLDHYRRLIGLLADRVRSVALRFQTGAFLVGRPGSGKTFTVKAVLDEAVTVHGVECLKSGCFSRQHPII